MENSQQGLRRGSRSVIFTVGGDDNLQIREESFRPEHAQLVSFQPEGWTKPDIVDNPILGSWGGIFSFLLD